MSLVEILPGFRQFPWHSDVQSMNLAVVVPNINVIVALQLSWSGPGGAREAQQMRGVCVEARGRWSRCADIPDAGTSAAITGHKLVGRSRGRGQGGHLIGVRGPRMIGAHQIDARKIPDL